MEYIDAEIAPFVDAEVFKAALAAQRASYAELDAHVSEIGKKKPAILRNFGDCATADVLHDASATAPRGSESHPFAAGASTTGCFDQQHEATGSGSSADLSGTQRIRLALTAADGEVRAQIAARLKSEAELRAVRAELAAVLRRVRTAESAAETAEAKRAHAVAANTALQARLAAVRATHDAAVRSASQAEQRAAAAAAECETLRAAVAAASRLPAQLQAAKDQLAAAKARAAAADSLRAEVQSLQKDRAALQRQVDKAATRIAEHEGEFSLFSMCLRVRFAAAAAGGG